MLKRFISLFSMNTRTTLQKPSWNVKVMVAGPKGHYVYDEFVGLNKDEYQKILSHIKDMKQKTGVWFYLEN